MYVARINQTGARTNLDSTSELGAKAEASRWQSAADRAYPMCLYISMGGRDEPETLEPVARKENGRWTAI
jgi:hypothetical protein